MKKYERVLSQKEEREIKKQAKEEKKFRKDYKKKLHPKRINAAKGSKKLQKNTPFSERWFYDTLAKMNFPYIPEGNYPKENFGLGIRNPQYNHYIPDIINSVFKFLIEVDDSSHDKKIKYDKIRDKHFRSEGYKTVRIKYNDIPLLRKGMHKIARIILESNKLHCPDTKKALEEWVLWNT